MSLEFLTEAVAELAMLAGVTRRQELSLKGIDLGSM